MAAPRFILSNPKAKKETTIYFIYRMGSKDRIKYNTGERIHPDDWDFDLQRANDNGSSRQRLHEINTQIGRYRKLIRKLEEYVWESNPENKTLEYLWNELEQEFKEKPQTRTPVEFFTWINNFIETAKLTRTKKNRRPLSHLTKAKYKTTRNLLRQFTDKERKGKLKFADIDLQFYDDFVSWMQTEHNMAENTIGKYIKTLKTFLNAARMDKYHKIKLHDDVLNNIFAAPSDDAHHTFLNEGELQQLYQLDLTSKKLKRLDKVRDIFLIACRTALRYSDFGSLKPENFIENRTILKVQPHKTGKDVYIPVHPWVKEIMDKWDWYLPRPMTNQVMNRYIKDLCKLAGIKSPIVFTRIKGGKEEQLTKEKWEMISTHSARRTAATNWYLADMKPLDIMKITGHKSEAVFLSYIRLTDQQHAQKMLLNPYFMETPQISMKVTQDATGWSATAKAGNRIIGARAETFEQLKPLALEIINLTFQDRGIHYTIDEVVFEHAKN